MILKIFWTFTFLVVCDCSFSSSSTLKQLVTIFRHGDRTTDLGATYPTDPHVNESYAPYGGGELTNLGKNRMYGLGQSIRKLYNSFLGSLYVPSELSALSTNFRRTKCSLQLFLTGLFPPRGTALEWNIFLNWNPIAYDYVDPETDRVMSFPMFFCPKYQRIYEAYWESPEATAINDQYKSLYPYISQNTGLNITFIRHLFELYFTLATEEEWGLRLPKWTERVYPWYMIKATEDNYKLFTANAQLNQLFGGFLVKKIINDMLQKLNKSLDQPNMYVYSGHEMTVISALGALNLFYPHIPIYSACLVLELHEINQRAFVKVRYNKNSFDSFDDMVIPGCQLLCPFEDFVRLVSRNLPEDGGDPCIEKEAQQ